MEKTKKISLLLLLGTLVFGLWSPVANAALSITTRNANSISYSSAVLNGVLNEGSLSVTAWFELGTNSNNFNLSTSPQYYNSLSNNYSALVPGLNSNTIYYFRAVAENSQGRVYGNILSFTTSYYDSYYNTNNLDYSYYGNLPTITTGTVAGIGPTSAILNGFVNGNNLSTTAWFEWGTNNNFSHSTTQNYYGYNARNYDITLTGLMPSTVYYFRAVAQNAKGRVFGETISFTTGLATYINYLNTNYYPTQTYYPVQATPATALTAKTDWATSVSSTSAQLNGMITNQETIPSSTYFEWGINSNLNNRTETVSTGAFTLVKHVNKLTGLTPNTTYYFRLVADNGFSRNVGATNYFTTNQAVVSVSSTKSNNESTIETSTNNNNTATITPVNYLNQPTVNSLGANIIGVNFLPGSLFGWLLLVIFILMIAILIQRAFTPVIVKQEYLEHF